MLRNRARNGIKVFVPVIIGKFLREHRIISLYNIFLYPKMNTF